MIDPPPKKIQREWIIFETVLYSIPCSLHNSLFRSLGGCGERCQHVPVSKLVNTRKMERESVFLFFCRFFDVKEGNTWRTDQKLRMLTLAVESVSVSSLGLLFFHL